MKKHTILVSFINAVGHANACFGAMVPLLSRGHRIIVVLEAAFRGKAAKLGFEEHLYQVKKPNEENSPPITGNPGESFAKNLFDMKIIGPYSCEEKIENLLKFSQTKPFAEEFTKLNEAVKEAIELYAGFDFL